MAYRIEHHTNDMDSEGRYKRRYTCGSCGNDVGADSRMCPACNVGLETEPMGSFGKLILSPILLPIWLFKKFVNLAIWIIKMPFKILMLPFKAVGATAKAIKPDKE